MRRIIFISFILHAIAGFSQRQATIVVEGVETATIKFSDSLSMVTQSRDFINGLWKQGYLFASVDSVSGDKIYVHRGAKLNWQGGQFKDLEAIQAKAKKELSKKVNTGYPFARISWDSVEFSGQAISASYIIEEGPLVLNDSIVLLSQIKTKRSFLAKTIGFQPGDRYSERSFQSIEKRLDRVSFLTLTRPPDVSFQSGSAWTYLDLKEANTGSFKGVLGLLPNQGSNSNALVTGSIDLRLDNLFRTGKLLDVSWNRFGELSQELDLRYEHPYLAGSDLTIGGELHLLRQDSAFINQRMEIGGSIFVKNQLSLGASYEQENSSVLLSQSERIVALNLLDYRQDRYNVALKRSVNNPAAFKNYFGFETKVGVGQRSVNEIASLPVEYYDSIDMKSTNVLAQVRTSVQRKVTKKSSIYHRASGSFLSGQLSQNQLFRIGGLQTLRGFNEQFFFAEAFLIHQLEWRYFFEESSHFFVFADQGFVKNGRWAYPIGLGGGFSLTTNSGLFSFAMAIGRVEGVPFDLANTKVHFGYTSQF